MEQRSECDQVDLGVDPYGLGSRAACAIHISEGSYGLPGPAQAPQACWHQAEAEVRSGQRL